MDDTQNTPLHSVNLYAIKDAATNSFGVLFESRSDPEAMRMMSHHMSQRPDDLLAMYPKDYQLYRVGRYDKAIGQVTAELEYIAPLNQLVAPKSLETAA